MTRVVNGVTGEGLLARPVRLRGIRLGRPTDALLELEQLRVVGLEVLCGDAQRRFLPLAACRVEEDELSVTSSLLLLDEPDLAFYRRRGRSLRSLLGAPVQVAGRPVGRLADLELDAAGRATALLVVPDGDGGGGNEGRRRIPADGSVRILEPGRASAA